MTRKRKSDGLGGFYGVSDTIDLGSRTTFTLQKIHILIMSIVLTSVHTDNSCSSLSLTLALQRSNEMYKNIKYPYQKVKCQKDNGLLIYYIAISLFAITTTEWVIHIFVLSGDVELNPGPNSVEGSTDSVSSSSISSIDTLTNHLSILHLNIQSIASKLDVIEGEAASYDVLVFSESWLKPEVTNESLHIENFSPPFRADRGDRPGGGVIVYVRDTMSSKRRSDLEVQGLEAVWVEIQVKSKKVLVGGFYRPPNSNINYFNLINESADRAYNTNIQDIIILGDFNVNMLNDNNDKIKDLMQEFHMKQLINEPTNFTEHSATLLDLILVRNEANILTSGVIDTFIPDLVRYHCPVIILLKFLRPVNKNFKRKVWNYKLANFDRYREILTDFNLEEKVNLSTDINDNINCISEAIMSAAEQTIPNKIVMIRPNEHPWITCQIRKLIRKRKRTYSKYKRTSNIFLWEKYKIIRNKIVLSIRKSKKEYFDMLDSILSSGTTNMKLFWKTSTQLLDTRKSASVIPTLTLNNEHAETDIQKATLLNDYFTTQSTVIDDNLPLPQLPPVDHILHSISISIQDVKDVLKNLVENKSCGPDLISPRLLKQGSCALAIPLSTVFNRSLDQGYFPQVWKQGNLTPIH